MKIASVFGPVVGGAFMLNVPVILPAFVEAMGLENSTVDAFVMVASGAAVIIGLLGVVVGVAAAKEQIFNDVQDSAPSPRSEPAPVVRTVTLETAPGVLADRSGDQDLQVAVKAFEASRSAWESMTRDDIGNGARSRLLHGIRTLREACLNTFNNPDLANDREALKSIRESMARLTAEMDRFRTARKQGDLLSLEQDLSIMERQLFLQPISATKELA